MNFAFSEEQEELRRAVRQFLESKSPETEVRRLMETTEGFDPACGADGPELMLQGCLPRIRRQGFTFIARHGSRRGAACPVRPLLPRRALGCDPAAEPTRKSVAARHASGGATSRRCRSRPRAVGRGRITMKLTKGREASRLPREDFVIDGPRRPDRRSAPQRQRANRRDLVCPLPRRGAHPPARQTMTTPPHQARVSNFAAHRSVRRSGLPASPAARPGALHSRTEGLWRRAEVRYVGRVREVLVAVLSSAARSSYQHQCSDIARVDSASRPRTTLRGPPRRQRSFLCCGVSKRLLGVVLPRRRGDIQSTAHRFSGSPPRTSNSSARKREIYLGDPSTTLCSRTHRHRPARLLTGPYHLNVTERFEFTIAAYNAPVGSASSRRSGARFASRSRALFTPTWCPFRRRARLSGRGSSTTRRRATGRGPGLETFEHAFRTASRPPVRAVALAVCSRSRSTAVTFRSSAFHDPVSSLALAARST